MMPMDAMIQRAWREGRQSLYEHEVCDLLSRFDCFAIPKSIFVRADKQIDQDDIDQLDGDKCVLKLIAPTLTHKSEIDAVRTVAASAGDVNRTIAALLETGDRLDLRPAGVLCCQYVEHDQSDPAGEMYVGIRVSRDFGPVMAAGFGGVHSEYWANVLQPQKSVALAVIDGLSADAFLALFRRTACYDLIAGRTRGCARRISDDVLLDCFEAYIRVANALCVSSVVDAPTVCELEVNPFAIRNGKLIPLDGVCRIACNGRRAPPRPLDRIDQLLHPESVAIVGVARRTKNLGRIILSNLIAAGFPRDNLWIIHPNVDSIDDVPCVTSLSDLPNPVDLVIVAVSAAEVVRIVEETVGSRRATAVILITGGMGETESGRDVENHLRNRIANARTCDANGGPVVLGGNCMGALSRPGRLDTLFVPEHKLDKHLNASPQPVALISQSGAFAITRLSNLDQLAPQYVVTCGNQIDLTVSDCLRFLIKQSDVRVFGVYVEGFADLDGLAMTRAVREATACGKLVVLYKAGRSAAGRRAIEGHTAALAGDYLACTEAMTQAGAVVTHTFGEFESALGLAVASMAWRIRGPRVFALSNAGFEAVGIADLLGDGLGIIELPRPSTDLTDLLRRILAQHHLENLINVRNPLDVTPMATDAVHAQVLAAVLADPDVDGVIHGFVPQTPAMKTVGEELVQDECLLNQIQNVIHRSEKPVVIVVDSGRIYDDFANGFISRGIAVFRSADVAVKTLSQLVEWRILANAKRSVKTRATGARDAQQMVRREPRTTGVNPSS